MKTKDSVVLVTGANRGIGLAFCRALLARGARIFSLGNPLDVGFAVTEGGYNGLAERHYLPTLFFGGSLSPGMSGGPALDAQGRLVKTHYGAFPNAEAVRRWTAD